MTPLYDPPMDDIEILAGKLERYFSARPEVAMAFLFGSAARGQQTRESDLDVAVHFYPKTRALEWEEEREYGEADQIWGDVDAIAGVDTDLVVLNQAPATLAYAVLDEGRPIVVKDAALYWRFFLTISSAAEDFREFAREYHAIKLRCQSSSEADETS